MAFWADFGDFFLVETTATIFPALVEPAIAVAIPASFLVARLVVVARTPILKGPVILRHHCSFRD